METVNIDQAKTNLSELLSRVELGEEIIISSRYANHRSRSVSQRRHRSLSQYSLCMQFADFWYIVALSDQLRPNTVLARSLLGEWLAIFRGEDGQPVALRDRCLNYSFR